MKQFKILTAAFFLAFCLSFASPAPASAVSFLDMPPAVVFTQAKGDRMLVGYNFDYDKRIFVAGRTNTDQGFYFSIN